MEMMKTDLLVIGSGAAGLTAAVYAARSGDEVLVVDKGVIAKSGSTVGAVQLTARGPWIHEGDSTEAYYHDIIHSGRGLSNRKLARILAEEIEFVLQDFIDWGLKLESDEAEQPLLFEASGHQFPRSVSARKGKTGLALLRTLMRQANPLPNLKRRSDVMVVKIVTQQKRAIGAIAYDFGQAQFFYIQCKGVILASGGIGQLYPMTSNPIQSTGDGFSLALQAGATLMDMEQVQFYPVSVLQPRSLNGFCISFYHKAKLYNENGERFMERYDPVNLENVTRDQIAHAIAMEIQSGRGTDAGGVWLDATDIIPYVKHAFPEEYDMCLQKGIDLSKERIQVAPAAHFIMGGVRVDEHGGTGIDGLYAVGETAGGLHGGNRLANNALSECIAFGARVGRAASLDSKKQVWADLDEVSEPPVPFPVYPGYSEGQKVCRPHHLKENLRRVMGRFAGVLRTEEDLTHAEQELEKITMSLKQVHVVGAERPFSREALDYLELQHMLLTAQAIVGAAKIRRESIGAHQRIDFPNHQSQVEHTTTELNHGQLEFGKERVGDHATCAN